MFDLSATQQMQRAHGHAFGRFALREGRARIADLGQRGSAKLMLPRVAGPVPEAVFLNTSGGLTGGDRLSFALELEAGVQVAATTQTAERAYESRDGAARVSVRAVVGAGGRLDWLPQETILFQASHLERSTEIDLAQDATCLACESLILGRVAMGERVTTARITDRRMIRRAGRPVWAETLMLDPDVLARRDNPALLGGAGALGVAVLVARGAEDAAGSLRNLSATPGARMEVSGWDGRVVARVLAVDGLALRRQMARIITTLSGRALPRVWLAGGTT